MLETNFFACKFIAELDNEKGNFSKDILCFQTMKIVALIGMVQANTLGKEHI